MNRALFTSNSDEYSTPQELYKALDAEFHFNLDPCSTDENCKCTRHFTVENDGLSQNWGGGIEHFVIHRTAKLLNGLRRHTMKGARIIRWLYC